MIELTEVTKEYSKGVAALNGVNLKIDQGELRFYCRRQWFRKIDADPSAHEGAGAYFRNDCGKWSRTWEDYGIGRFQSIGDVLVLYIRISDF